MAEKDPAENKVLPISGHGADDEELRYEIVLLDRADGAKERVLAKAASAQLGQAIFNAAKSEHPDRRIILRRDTLTLAESPETGVG